MNLNLKNIVCVDLRVLNGKSLDKVAESIDTSFDQLEEFKKLGMAKVWIDLTSRYIVATQNKGEDIKVLPAYCPISKREVRSLIKMAPISYDQVKKKKTESIIKESKKETKNQVDLNVDSILDKISSSGMNSLTKEELEFLKNIK